MNTRERPPKFLLGVFLVPKGSSAGLTADRLFAFQAFSPYVKTLWKDIRFSPGTLRHRLLATLLFSLEIDSLYPARRKELTGLSPLAVEKKEKQTVASLYLVSLMICLHFEYEC
jgi:hypothetical protein